jgi:peroxiredoxin
MKKILFLTVVIIMSGCSDRDHAVKTGLEGKTLPSFSILLMDSTTKINMNNVEGRPAVVFILYPYCPFCRAQTEAIVKNISNLKDIDFYIVSNSPFQMVKAYAKRFQLQNYSNITVGQDYENLLSSYYKVSAVPFMAIYDKRKKLKQAVLGDVSIDLIKNIAIN